jgi:tetratricopeptide (TPR) repeat protein
MNGLNKIINRMEIQHPNEEIIDKSSELTALLQQFEEVKKFKDNVGEHCQDFWKLGKQFIKWRKFDLAMECFDAIINESDKDIKAAEVSNYSYKAHQKKARMLFEVLCFKTALFHLNKAEEIIEGSINELYVF